MVATVTHGLNDQRRPGVARQHRQLLVGNHAIDVAAPLRHIINFSQLQIVFEFTVDRLFTQFRLYIVKIGQAVAIADHNQPQLQRHWRNGYRQRAGFVWRNPMELTLADHLLQPQP